MFTTVSRITVAVPCGDSCMVAEGGVSDFRDIIEDMNITKYGYDLKAQRNLLERNGIIMEG